MWELREEESNSNLRDILHFLRGNVSDGFELFLQYKILWQVLPLFIPSIHVAFDFT